MQTEMRKKNPIIRSLARSLNPTTNQNHPPQRIRPPHPSIPSLPYPQPSPLISAATYPMSRASIPTSQPHPLQPAPSTSRTRNPSMSATSIDYSDQPRRALSQLLDQVSRIARQRLHLAIRVVLHHHLPATCGFKIAIAIQRQLV